MSARIPAVIGLLLILLFGVRAVFGVIAGYSLRKGVQLAESGRYEEALPLLELADVGFQRNEALQWRARTRISVWRRARALDELGDDPNAQLREAASDYLEAAAASPAVAWPWAGLARVYRNAGTDEAKRTGPSSVSRNVGIQLGLLQRAVERNPHDAYYRDELALAYRRLGLRDRMLDAVREAARVQPVFEHHAFRFLRPDDPDLLRVFSETAVAALDETPMVPRLRHLVSLAKLEHRRREYGAAEGYLHVALLEVGADLNRAEVHYWLGLSVYELGRLEEAERELRLAMEIDPAFEPAGLARIAEIQVRQGLLREALETLRKVRRLRPREVGHSLRFARISRELEDWPAASEALRWAIQLEPTRLSHRVELFEGQLRSGKTSAARRSLRELSKRSLPEAELERLRGELELRTRGPAVGATL